MTRLYSSIGRSLMPAAIPLLIAAAPPGAQGLDTPTLLLVTTAIVGVVLLRGILLRRHLRKRRPLRRDGTQHGAQASTDASADDIPVVGDTERD